MKILVCVKQILDPETPPKEFKLDPQTRVPVRGNAKLVMDSYAENALEVALQIKASLPETTITVVAVADKPADEALRRAYALTADEALRVWEAGWEELDGGAVAHVLAGVARQKGPFDLVMLGRQAGDVERGVVGPMLAEELGYPCTTIVSRVKMGDSAKAHLWREVDGGMDVMENRLPLVVTVTNDDTNVPRLPKVKDLMMATRKPIALLGAGDLDLNASALEPRLEMQNVYIPVMDGNCEIMEGDDGPAKAQALTQRLKELKVV